MAPQRGGHASSSSHPGLPEAQPLPDGAMPLFPAMPLPESEEGPQDGGHEVTGASCCFSSIYRLLLLHGFSAGHRCQALNNPQGGDKGTSKNGLSSESSIRLSLP